MKQTILHQKHLQLKAKLTDFQGWQVPQVYSDVLEEYHAVRAAAGLFDVSFLGRIGIAGPDAASLLERVFTRNVAKIAERSAHYGLICNEDGKILDDEVLFRLSDVQQRQRFLLSTNAINTPKILSWLTKQCPPGVTITDRTYLDAQFSLQGPRSTSVLDKLLGPQAKKFKPRVVKEFSLLDSMVLISRTGYTGEQGYEFFVPAEKAPQLWDDIMTAGAEFGVLPCGIMSRDIVRLEMGYLLYGNDIDETHTPFEAGLERFISFQKDFIGKDVLLRIRNSEPERKLAGFELLEKNAPRNGASIFSENREIGSVTSACISPGLRKGIGFGYVVRRYSQPGQEIEIEIRDKETAAKIVDVPFYKKK